MALAIYLDNYCHCCLYFEKSWVEKRKKNDEMKNEEKNEKKSER